MFAVVIALAATVGTLVCAGRLTAYTLNYRLHFLAAWATTLFGLSLALSAMAIGSIVGFGTNLFRWMEVGGSLIAPLSLAFGVVTLIARKVEVRFGSLLAVASYAIVAIVILLVDPIPGTFKDELPTPDLYDWLPFTLIAGAHILAVGTLVTAAAVTALRVREGDPEAFEILMPVALIAGAGVFIVAGMGGYLPDLLTLLALAGSVALVWYGTMRALWAPEDEDEDAEDDSDWAGGRGRERSSAHQPAGPRRDETDSPRRAGRGTRGIRGGQGGHAGHEGPGEGRGRRGRRAATGAEQEATQVHAAVAPPAAEPSPGRSRRADPYGHITVFTLLEGQEETFDRLTKETVRAVRELEPDTLVYACHTARNSPHQRVFYQLFRDRAAYQAHERQPHVRHFLTAGRQCVRTTKVIELTLGPYKVVPPHSA